MNPGPLAYGLLLLLPEFQENYLFIFNHVHFRVDTKIN